MTRLLAFVSLLFVVALPLCAQTSAIVTDFRMITEMNGGAPDTAIIHSIAAGNRQRLESKGNAPSSISPFGSIAGNVQIVTVADSDITMDYLNSDSKTYFEFKPLEMMKGAREMMKSLGADNRMTSTGDTVVIDSLGDGGVVMGYPTIHFHSYSAHYFTMSMMGESTNMAIRQSTDSYVSPKFKQEWAAKDSNAFTPEKLTEMLGKLSDIMPMGMDSVIAHQVSKMARITRAGTALKTVMEMTNTAMGMTSTTKQTMEILKVEQAVVPDSTFTVPADYKKTEPLLRRAPVGGGN